MYYSFCDTLYSVLKIAIVCPRKRLTKKSDANYIYNMKSIHCKKYWSKNDQLFDKRWVYNTNMLRILLLTLLIS